MLLKNNPVLTGILSDSLGGIIRPGSLGMISARFLNKQKFKHPFEIRRQM